MIDLQNQFKAAVSFAVPFSGGPTVMTEGYGGKELGIDLSQNPAPSVDLGGPNV